MPSAGVAGAAGGSGTTAFAGSAAATVACGSVPFAGGSGRARCRRPGPGGFARTGSYGFSSVGRAAATGGPFGGGGSTASCGRAGGTGGGGGGSRRFSGSSVSTLAVWTGAGGALFRETQKTPAPPSATPTSATIARNGHSLRGAAAGIGGGTVTAPERTGSRVEGCVLGHVVV